MREFKFRVWDTGSKRYFYDISPLPAGFKNFHPILLNPGLEAPTLVVQGREEVIIQQYTGLKDKNGKEIYEGDIFESTNPKEILVRFVVQWGYRDNPYSWGFKSLLNEGKSYEFYDVKDSMKIIGNIYENPELLKQHC